MGNAPKDASSPPEKAGEDEDILKLLNSAAWEKRLEAARLQREKILAERAKSGAPRKPTLFPKTVSPDRMPVLENSAARAPKAAANRPAPAAKPATVASPLPALPKTIANAATAAQPQTPPARPSAVTPEAVPPEPKPPVAARRPITPVRVALGFGLGLVVGVGATSASWLFRAEPVPVSEAAVATVAEPPATAAVAADETPAAIPVAEGTAAPGDAAETAPATLTAKDDAFPGPPEATTAVAALSDPDPMGAATMGAPIEPEIETSQVDALQTPLAGENGVPVSEQTPFQPDIPSIEPEAGPQPDREADLTNPAELADLPHSAPSPGDTPKAAEPSADLPVVSIDPAPAQPEMPVPAAEVATAPAPVYPPHQVIVYAPESTADGKAEKETEGLASAGFTVDQPRRVDLTIRKDQVRFYHDEDKIVADAVALSLGAEARDFTKSDHRPPSGTIEVWLAGDAPAATAAVTVSKPASKVKTSKPKKKAVAPPSGPTEEQQLQMLQEKIVKQLRNGGG